MTSFVCDRIIKEIDRVLSRAIYLLWMASLREQLERERNSVRH
jgi:hypothetical protein